MTTAQYRQAAREAESRLDWQKAATLYRAAVDAHTGHGALADLDRANLQRKADAAQAMVRQQKRMSTTEGTALTRLKASLAEHQELAHRSSGHAQKADDLAVLIDAVEAMLDCRKTNSSTARFLKAERRARLDAALRKLESP